MGAKAAARAARIRRGLQGWAVCCAALFLLAAALGLFSAKQQQTAQPLQPVQSQSHPTTQSEDDDEEATKEPPWDNEVVLRLEAAVLEQLKVQKEIRHVQQRILVATRLVAIHASNANNLMRPRSAPPQAAFQRERKEEEQGVWSREAVDPPGLGRIRLQREGRGQGRDRAQDQVEMEEPEPTRSEKDRVEDEQDQAEMARVEREEGKGAETCKGAPQGKPLPQAALSPEPSNNYFKEGQREIAKRATVQCDLPPKFRAADNMVSCPQLEKADEEYAAAGRMSPPESFRLTNRNNLGWLLNQLNVSGPALTIGVNEGDFTDIVSDDWNAFTHWFLVDPWEMTSGGMQVSMTADVDQAYCRVKRRYEAKFGEDRVTLMKAYSSDVVAAFPDNYFAFIYIDGNHFENFVRDDLINFWPKLSKGGLFAGHDYNTAYAGSGPKVACDKFVATRPEIKMKVTDEMRFPKCCPSFYWTKP